MEKAEELEIQDSHTLFEVLLICLKNSFYNDQIKNVGLLANNNKILKSIIDKGEFNHGYERVKYFFNEIKTN